jgi:CelD/BcsL family acetyltransferase involved in cellulose biosynthesis
VTLEAELITDLAALERLAPEWDALAMTNRSPLSAPAWMLAAWRHLIPRSARLCTVAVRERGDLVAIAPFYADCTRRGRVDLRLLGAPMPRIGPLAVPGREWEAAKLAATALARAVPRPDVVSLESAPLGSPWPVALAHQWPGRLRPPLRQYLVQSSLTVSLRADSFEEWLAGKSATLRRETRRARRRIADAGGAVRHSTQATLKEDIATFLRLHASRWEGRGQSSIVAREDEIAAIYEEIGREQLDSGRFRLLLIELDGEPIAAGTWAAAGGEVIDLNGGWDERFARLAPGMMCMIAGIEEGFARGDERLDLGPGEQQNKLRLADGNDPVSWTMLIVPRARLPVTFTRANATVMRIAARDSAKRVLTETQAERLRSLRTALRR